MRWPSYIPLVVMAIAVQASPAAAPATQPVTALVAGVLVLPFTALGEVPGGPAWMGRAVQQNLLADLGRAHFHPIGPTEPAPDSAAAARDAGAEFAITGTYQSADGVLRFTGQIVNAADGRVVGGLSATGARRDLYGIEDALSSQALQQLRQLNKPPLPPPPVVRQAAPAAPAPIAGVGAVAGGYQGSALQRYVDGNRTPSQDYWDQYRASADRQSYWGGVNYGEQTGYYGGYGYPYGVGYGYSTPFFYLRYTPGRAIYFGNDYATRP